MYIKKWVAGLFLVLLTATVVVFAANENSINLTFNGEKVSPEIRVLEKNQVRYINLPFLKYLHVINDWNPTEGSLDLRMGKYSILMYENDTKYQVNDKPRNLNNAPFQQDNQLWLPVEFLLRLGLVIRSEDRKNLNLEWENNYLLGIENVTYQNRTAFLLIGSKRFNTKSFLLTKPDRLVVDITGIKAHFTLDCSPGEDPIVKKIRFSQITPDTVRLVFDLNQLVGYKIIPNPDQPNQTMVVFNYLVKDISFFRKDEEKKVYIKTSFPAVYNVKSFNAPNRLIIDLDGATLTGTNAPINGDGKWVSRVRMSQFTPETVRVVLDLIGPDPCFVIHSRENPNLIEVRTLQTINRLSWAETGQGGRLTIEADGELVDEITKLKDPEQLQVGLDFSQFSPGLKAPEFKSNQVKGIHLVPVSSSEVRLDIDLAYYIGYEAQLSADRRILNISFKRSPLIGRTIIIDPGHGGVDPGACGRQGTLEKEINLDVSMRLKDLLEGAGAAVVLTRTDDSFIGLYERPFLANYLFGDLFISIHTNNHPDLSVHGIEVWVYQERQNAQVIAKNVLDNITKTTGFKALNIKKSTDLIVNRETQMPSILVELGFLSNFQEESTIMTPEFRQNAAQGIYQGVIQYYQR